VARPRLYLDEDVYQGVALGLRRRGFDAITTLEAGQSAASDEEQLAFAAAAGRCLFTFNRGHFAAAHSRLIDEGGHHAGVIVCRQLDVGTIVRTLAAFLSTHSAEELRDQLVWLSPQG
jgi:predicted nuclease of predicted toxin-antitoxin system